MCPCCQHLGPFSSDSKDSGYRTPRRFILITVSERGDVELMVGLDDFNALF